MKKLTNFLLDIKFSGINLDDVEKMIFVFAQDGKRLLFNFPSNDAIRDGDVISLKWDINKTKMFQAGREIKMDYIVKLIGIDQNPETSIVTMIMEPTLFRPEEVDDF